MADTPFRPKKFSPEKFAEEDQDNGESRVPNVGAERFGVNPQSFQNTDPSGFEPPKIQGNVPPEMRKFMNGGADPEQRNPNQPSNLQPRRQQPLKEFESETGRVLQDMLEEIRKGSETFEEVSLPSLGRFYEEGTGPSDGVLHVRPMTGVEEKILATQRLMKKGLAINQIFQNCVQEKINPDNLLSIDRTYLLIYLRSISYGTNYEVKIKCPECSHVFNETIDLDTLPVTYCPEDFTEDTLEDTLPVCGFKFRYRMSKGIDETKITDYREKILKMWGEAAEDDTLTFRSSLLITELISNHGKVLTGQHNIKAMLDRMHIKDLAHIRNTLSEPPFGMDAKIVLDCPSCGANFTTELPLEANFFFPRTRKKQTSPR
jgi:hypothetical protein